MAGMRWLIALALLARFAAADPAVDYQRAKLHALTAHNLAHDGHCTEALAMRRRIEELDAEVARVAYTEDPMLVACANDPRLGPPSLSPVVVPTPPPHKACATRAYLEPLLLMLSDGGQPTVFNRIAAGVLLRSCTSPVQVRLGATTYIGHIGQIGVGLETEASAEISDGFRLGFHLAYETGDGGAVESADLRLHIQDAAWVQVGSFGWSRWNGVDSGVSAGLGFEGTPGALLGGVEAGLGGLLFLVVVASLSEGHG